MFYAEVIFQCKLVEEKKKGTLRRQWSKRILCSWKRHEDKNGEKLRLDSFFIASDAGTPWCTGNMFFLSFFFLLPSFFFYSSLVMSSLSVL